MKKLLSIVIVAFLVFSCTVEPVEMEATTAKETENQLRLPIWLSGTYQGVHTQKPLVVTDTMITFAFMDASYTYNINDFVQEIHEEGRYTLITSDNAILIFNKTTKEDEINLHFNELNLGWFVFVQPE